VVVVVVQKASAVQSHAIEGEQAELV